MPKFTDQTYLKTDQYRDASNLNARIEIHRRFSTNPQGWFLWVWDILEKLPKTARVLELGCGAGSLWTACPERIPAGWSLTLSDLSEGMLKSAWRNLVVIGRGFKFEQIDAQSIPYPDETFDIVIANHMLYHVPYRPKALAEIRRVLRSPDAVSGKGGGNLVATTVGENHLKEMHDWFLRVKADMDLSAGTNPFTLENGLKQLSPYFGQVESRRYVDSLRITEITPLMAYLRSSMRAGEAPGAAFAQLEQELTSELQSKGAIHVTKDSGLFLAVK
jgi:ubiquinone/menaquinone biosynthesis C-methylase UbiE